jgi:hypothetical protein
MAGSRGVRASAGGGGCLRVASASRGASWGAAALRSTLPTTIRARGIARYDPGVEAAVYFSCVEALQNAAKHAGPEASITLYLSGDDQALRFEVVDTGVGFDQHLEKDGSGLTHIRDRVGAVGGHATISFTADDGTSISATIPLAGDPTERPSVRGGPRLRQPPSPTAGTGAPVGWSDHVASS